MVFSKTFGEDQLIWLGQILKTQLKRFLLKLKLSESIEDH